MKLKQRQLAVLVLAVSAHGLLLAQQRPAYLDTHLSPAPRTVRRLACWLMNRWC